MTLRQRLAAALAPELDRAHIMDVNLYMDRPMPDGPFTRAAVLIAITDRPEPGMLLTQRNPGLRAHAGQVALPGGRLDPQDADAVAAALREAEEEIALPRGQVDVIGRSDLFRTGTGFEIVPIVGIVPPDLPLRPAEAEVDAIFEVPLAPLLDPASWALRTIEWEGRTRSYYEYLWQDRRIWGVTAAMLVNLARRIAAVEADVARTGS